MEFIKSIKKLQKVTQVVSFIQECDEYRVPHLATGVLRTMLDKSADMPKNMQAIIHNAIGHYECSLGNENLGMQHFLTSLRTEPTEVALSNVFARIPYMDEHDQKQLTNVAEQILSIQSKHSHIDMDGVIFAVAQRLYAIKRYDLMATCFQAMKCRALAELLMDTMIVPAAYMSAHDVDDQHKRFHAALERALMPENLKQIKAFYRRNPMLMFPKIGYYLIYTGLNTLGIHITLRKFYEAVFPYLFHDATKNKKTTPDGAASGEKTGVKKRLGIMSNSLYCADFTNHSVSKVFSGVIQQLDREVYDIFIFGFTSGISNAKNPNLNGSSEESVTFVELKTIRNEPLQTTMTRWHSTVEGMHLDMLLYLDIGMDPYTYMLSFARLAPIQVTTWGHPDCHATTMDYYITSTVFNNDPKLHREKLVYMDGCSFSFEKPYGLLERPKMNRSEFGIPENFHVYMCAQSIFKITPAFDPVVIGILERDANGIVVFLDTEASGFFRETIQRRLQKYAHRLLFIPKVPSVEYVACCRMADVLLDAFPFSGGITSLECFAAGLPIVTMNMPHIRGSQTTSYYRLMGFTDLIGNDVEQYVKNAVRLAKDREFKTHCANTIHAKKKVLYNNSDVGDKWNRLLLDLCALQST